MLRRQGYPAPVRGGLAGDPPGPGDGGPGASRRSSCPTGPISMPSCSRRAKPRGVRRGGQNSWVIESLGRRDVMVVDIFGKVKDGTVVGDNLGTAVKVRTGAGAVIDGGIRDYQGLVELDDVNFYFRGMDPSAIADVTLAGINIPVRIGLYRAARRCGPRHADRCYRHPPAPGGRGGREAEDTIVRDRFGKLRLAEGKYTSGDIDVALWSQEIEADFEAWRQAAK